MKAFVQTKFGPPEVLQLQEVPRPAPQENELLLKIRAVALNAYDWHFLVGEPALMRGMLKTKTHILGADVAGVVEAVGSAVTQFKPGDEVFGEIAPCGSGGMAEYAIAIERVLALKPAGLSFEEAAALPMAALTALQGLRDVGKIQPGQRVLVNGASGGVGSYAVQIAKALGAEVTAVTSPRNQELARTLGANYVIDYTKEDFTKSSQRYDLILAANGYHPILAYRRALAPRGVYAVAGGTWGQIFQGFFLAGLISKIGEKKMAVVSARVSQQDLLLLKEMVEAGKLKPVIDRVYAFEEIPAAMAYLGAGHARGKIVVRVG